MNKTTIIQARWLLPMNGKREILENQTIIIRDELIQKVMATDVFEQKYAKKYSDATKIVLANHVVMPGLINAHTHSAMSLFRGVADDIALMPWLENHIWPLEQKFVDADFVSIGSKLAIAEMLLSGVTCFNDMYLYPEVTAKKANEMGIRAIIGMPILDFPTVWASDVDEYLRKGLNMHDDWRDSPLICTAFAPHAPYTVGDGTLTRLRAIAEEIDSLIHMHVQETHAEVAQSLSQYNKTPLQRLDNLGLLDERFLAVHMVALDENDIDLVSSRNVNVIHCPQANLKLGSGIAPIQQMTEAGINIALGSDGAASNNDLDMFDEAKTAIMLAKGVNQDAETMTAWHGLEMLTHNAAKALAMDAKIGSITANKVADLIAIDMSKLNTMPNFNSAATLIYSALSSQVSHSWINGRMLVKNGKLLSFDYDNLVQQVAHYSDKITKSRQ